ncbi:MAG: GC-type dockerin domain-anchored protein, partial [Planctomycetota bacterium]
IGTDGSYIPETDAPGAIGIEDAFDILFDSDSDGVFEHFGTFYYGGFECVGSFNNSPFAQFYSKLYGPNTVCSRSCLPDVFPPGTCGDSLINFFDLSQFLDWFNAGDIRADWFPDQGDGELNFFDISEYLAQFSMGCN